MDSSRLMMFATASILLGMASCNETAPVQKADASRPVSLNDGAANEPTEEKVKIKIGTKDFRATVEDNATVAKLKELMPLTLKMSELNDNEKYYHLSTRLPTDEINPGTIQNGDIMLYGDNSLVLFYKTFKTSYGYTRIGRVDDPSGLADAVVTGDISVAFELENVTTNRTTRSRTGGSYDGDKSDKRRVGKCSGSFNAGSKYRERTEQVVQI